MDTAKQLDWNCRVGNSKYKGGTGSVFEINRFGCQREQAFYCFFFFACQF
jgi:hypothetical protein